MLDCECFCIKIHSTSVFKPAMPRKKHSYCKTLHTFLFFWFHEQLQLIGAAAVKNELLYDCVTPSDLAKYSARPRWWMLICITYVNLSLTGGWYICSFNQELTLERKYPTMHIGTLFMAENTPGVVRLFAYVQLFFSSSAIRCVARLAFHQPEKST